MDLIPIFALQTSRSSVSMGKHPSDVSRTWEECKGRKYFKKPVRSLEKQTTYMCLGVPGKDVSVGGGVGRTQVLQKGMDNNISAT